MFCIQAWPLVIQQPQYREFLEEYEARLSWNELLIHPPTDLKDIHNPYLAYGFQGLALGD
jgi:hypothetical protein